MSVGVILTFPSKPQGIQHKPCPLIEMRDHP